uniref:DUF4781 domain-containing protein n=1 Tax=Panagrellus redivivus TaxID=6233 RepID=A0A7E4W2L5_PANRE
MTGLIDGFSNSLYDDACKAHKEYYVLNYGIMYNLLKDTQEIIDEIAETIILVKAYKQSKSGEFKINVLYILYSKKDGTSETTTVFYFEAKDTSIKYIDLNGNVYKNWNKYLENNWIDSALVVYPEVGHYCHASVFHHESEPKLDMSESSLSIKRKNGDKVPVNSDIATAPELAYKFQEPLESATALAGIDTSNSPSRSNLLETFDNFAINHGLTLNGIVNTELSDNNRNRLNQILQCNENPTLWKTVETLTKLLNCDNAHMVAGLIEIVIFEVEITTAGFSDKKQRKAEKFEEFEEGFKKVLHDRQNNITIPSEYKVFLARIEERTNHFEERYRKQDPNIVK